MILPVVKPADLRLTFVDDFHWAGELRRGFPLLQMPDGTLCEPATSYFGHMCEIGRGTRGYLADVAYILREWIAYALSDGKSWDQADDDLMRRWRETQRLRREQNIERAAQQGAGQSVAASKPAYERPAPGRKRVEHKLAAVFDLYDAFPSIVPLNDDLQSLPRFVGERDAAPRRPITVETTLLRVDRGFAENRARSVYKEVRRWANGERVTEQPTRRHTPTTAEDRRISEYLRDEGGNTDTLPSSRLEARRVTAELRWLMGKCMSVATLRGAEVAALGLDEIWEALRKEGVVDALPDDTDGHALDLLADDEKGKDRIRAGLERLIRRGHTGLMVKVIGKRRPKGREARFPIDLIQDVLEIGVWYARREQVRQWTKADPKYRPPVNLFLSSRTMQGLKPGSIGDIMKDAFLATNVEGSGHRLRAKAGEDLAAQLCRDRIADNFFLADEGVLEWVLEELRDLMGNAEITVTLRNYVRLLMVQVNAVGNGLARRDARSHHARISKILQGLSVEDLGVAVSMLEQRFGRQPAA